MLPSEIPSFPFKLFKWFCRPEYHDDIEGDLLELYALRLKELGEKKARWAILWDVLLLFRPGIIRPIHLDIPF
ncbi:MAG: permease prefix domain 2-containing transporter, partial [Bacteroidota bacterium]